MTIFKRIPFFGRMRLLDYERIAVAFLVLLSEGILRFLAFTLPIRLLSYLYLKIRSLFSYQDYDYVNGSTSSSCLDGEDRNNGSSETLMLNSVGEVMTTTELAEYHGYGVEEHTIITEDGFLLVMHRLLPRIIQDDSFEDGTQANNISPIKGPFIINPSTGTSTSSGVSGSSQPISYSSGSSINQQQLPSQTSQRKLSYLRSKESINALKSQSALLKNRPPVLCLHGLMMTSEVWLCKREAKKNIVLALVDEGYDVWLANRRGNRYSHKHLTKSSSTEEYWDFSLDQTALIDLPKMIDHVLNCTGFGNLTFIGFSQGNAEGLAALTLHHKLSSKINLMICLAPTPKPRMMPNRIVRSLIQAGPELLFLLFGRKIFLRMTNFWHAILSPYLYSKLLSVCMWWLFGWSLRNLDAGELPIFTQHMYGYTSVKMIVHWFQVMRVGRLQLFDDTTALLYPGHMVSLIPISQIKTPIAVYYGGRDTISDPSYILERCQSAIVQVTNIPEYEHLDFMWARDVDEKVTFRLLSLLKHLRPKPHAKRTPKEEEVQNFTHVMSNNGYNSVTNTPLSISSFQNGKL